MFGGAAALAAAGLRPPALAAAEADALRVLHGFAHQQGLSLWMQGARARELQVDVIAGGAAVQTVAARLDPAADCSAIVELSGLEPGGEYRYVVRDAGGECASGAFRTQPLWQWRTDPPTVRIATGSCHYLNDGHFDRPGKPYGGGYEIFDTIAAASPDLMLWLGDNIYLREPEYTSREGINRRYRAYRAHPAMQRLMTAAPHVAIWDDHDFGPDDSDASYAGRGWTLEMFRRYWPLPYAPPAGGLYGMVTQGDVDIFLLDDRSWRDPDRWPEGADKAMYGAAQMHWLKAALVYSKAPFKLVAGGSQFFNDVSAPHVESWSRYPAEQRDLLDFLAARRIPGVIFLSGDRHFSQMLRVERPGLYPIHELTTSPLTSGVVANPGDAERGNPKLVAGSMLNERNFALVTVSGPRRERRIALELRDARGAQRFTWTASAAELAAGTRNT